MAEDKADARAAGQVELAVGRLDSLSVLPSVAARLLSGLLQSRLSPSGLAEIIESSPALAARIFSLMYQHGLSQTDEKPSVRQGLDKLPAHVVRDALLSVKVLQGQDEDKARPLPREQLAVHSIGVGCCAKAIAEALSVKMDSKLAYSAGLLHDIGKFALEEVMPESFARIVEQAKSTKAGALAIEQKYLGVDHTILGKRLAAKWHLPEQIILAIWLHHSQAGIISEDMPEARIAQIVQLADLVVRQCGIGQSGSYDSPASTGQIAQSLGINAGQLEQIRRNLAGTVEQKSGVLGLGSPNAAVYCEAAQSAIAQLAQAGSKQTLENRRLANGSSHFDFITDFLLSINSADGAIDIAESFAVRWQRFYQTGTVCVYLVPPRGSQTLEAVVVENLSQAKTVLLNVPADSSPIPRMLAKDFAIVNAQYRIDWLFEQLDADFDLRQTKLAPLFSGSKPVGAIVFELRYPSDLKLLEEKFKAVTSIAGSILDMASASGGRQHFAEQFARLLDRAASAQQQPGPADSLSALAEMAGGAAHELNNPLSVISGRAQLLAESESDPERKRILEQIQENTDELSAIVDDLMSFARPRGPRPERTDIKKMLDEAVQLTSRKAGAEHINVQIEVAGGLEDVFVDSAQIASAIANILCNSLESYSGEVGPIKITVDADPSSNLVKLAISDFGCGMDAETLQKATWPFFCSRPAGRGRGMGLAHAQRLIELNGGRLEITSQPGEGTTVTIYLPCK